MIKGIGTDIIEIERIRNAVNNKAFVSKVFNESEIKNIYGGNIKADSLAGKFSAKEAVSKALGTGVRGFSLKDIEILNDDLGKPYVVLKNKADLMARELGNYSILVSISHSRENAAATAILEVL